MEKIPTKPGKYAANGSGWVEIPSFSDRKKPEEASIPKSVVTPGGNAIHFERLTEVLRSGPVGNEATLYDNVAEPVPKSLYSILDNYNQKPLIVTNRQFDSLRNSEELLANLPNLETCGIASGRKPSGPCHFGHRLVIETITFFQHNGAQIFVPIADNEAGLDPKIKNKAHYKYFIADNLLDWGASGLNLDAAHIYLQSEEMRVMNIGYAMARGLDLPITVDVYGRDTLADEMNYLFASITQVGDILLPQHPDFGKKHSFMLSGPDQDGNMKMTMELASRAIGRSEYVTTIPSSLYITAISNLEGKKESASEPETTIYLGPSRNVYEKTSNGKLLVDIKKLSISERRADAQEKIDRFTKSDKVKVLEAIRRRQAVFEEFHNSSEMPISEFKAVLDGTLITHQYKRAIVYRHALSLAFQEAVRKKDLETVGKVTLMAQRYGLFDPGLEQSAPHFWSTTPKEAYVLEDKRNVKTRWFNLVVEMADQIIV